VGLGFSRLTKYQPVGLPVAGMVSKEVRTMRTLGAIVIELNWLDMDCFLVVVKIRSEKLRLS
jgi:hypothetical protein